MENCRIYVLLRTLFYITLSCTIICSTPCHEVRNTTPEANVGETMGKSGVYRMKRSRSKAAELAACNYSKTTALIVFAGEDVFINCYQCGIPDINNNEQNYWTIKLFLSGIEIHGREEIGETKNIKTREKARKLTITKISPEETGRYYCEQNKKKNGLYQITVLTSTDFHYVYPGEPAYSLSKFPDLKSAGIFTSWASWTDCSARKCGESGERMRIGFCTEPRENSLGGYPCRSYFFDQKHARMKWKDEMEFQSCKRPCTASSVVEIYSVESGMPQLAPFAKSGAVFVPAGENIKLDCPSVPITSYARWQKGDVMLKMVNMARPGGHMYVDGFHHLYINNVSTADIENFSCWHDNHMVITYKVKVVEPPLKEETIKGVNKIIIFSGMFLTLLVVVKIAVGVKKNQDAVNEGDCAPAADDDGDDDGDK